MAVWGGDFDSSPVFRRAFVPKSAMETDIYQGFTALQAQGHDSGVLLFVDEGESYAVIGKVFDRTPEDDEELNALVRVVINKQNSERYGSDHFNNGDGSWSTMHRYKNTLLALDLSQSFEDQWPFQQTVFSPQHLRSNFKDTQHTALAAWLR